MELQKQGLNNELEQLCQQAIEKESRERIQLQAKQKDERFTVMKKYKGFYWYDWKRERKSWVAAKCKMFFDFGGDFIWERVDDERLRKVSVQSFLESNGVLIPFHR